MNDWPEWPVCRRSELGDPGGRSFEVGGGTWPFRGFVIQLKGELRAFANICPHLSHPLDMLPDEFLVDEGELIRCASHGALFDADSGECVFGPCVGQSLLALDAEVDADGRVIVRAPASLRDAGEIIGGSFGTT